MKKVTKLVVLQGIFLLAFVLTAGVALAAVTGDCVNCHTMHNSQDGSAVSSSGFGAAWGSGTNPTISGGVDSAPVKNLLVSDCVGCHSSTTASTIVNIGDSRVPIVYNAVSPTNPLAGGNFFWLNGGDEFGHNVFGISGPDGILAAAPGGSNFGGSSQCTDCHGTLATAASGCTGCHIPAHHFDDPNTAAGDPVTSGDGWYRFLGYSMNAMFSSNADAINNYPGVGGIEDPDWEQTVSAAKHNVYQGTLTRYGDSSFSGYANNSIGELCAGCHADFHHDSFAVNSGIDDVAGGMGGLSGNPWLRHPSDVAIPTDGEYAAYTDYDPIAPVAVDNLSVGTFATLTDVRGAGATPIVTCISCHRAHGSPNPDMLRWDYGDCQTNTANAACGCFTCHTAKDGVP